MPLARTGFAVLACLLPVQWWRKKGTADHVKLGTVLKWAFATMVCRNLARSRSSSCLAALKPAALPEATDARRSCAGRRAVRPPPTIRAQPRRGVA